MESTPETKLHPAFADALEAERDSLNARFALRLRGGARIDPQAFTSHLRGTVNPLVAAVHDRLPERVRGVVVALYDVSLDLFAASLLGPEAKLPQVERVWREILPRLTTLLAREPQRVAGAMNNAVYQIASQSGTRPNDWLTRMADLAPHCKSVEQLLDVGKIVAWQAGMVQFRAAAIQTAEKIPHDLATRALQLSAETSEQQLGQIVKQLADDPWLKWDANSQPTLGRKTIELVATSGAFRGFGGPFYHVPTVRCHEQQLVVSDGKSDFHILADAFGTMFRRIGDCSSQSSDSKSKKSSPGEQPTIDKRGLVRWQDQQVNIPHLANATSTAWDGTTLGVTISTSHHVYLVGRSGA
jgi:hypothetical protein